MEASPGLFDLSLLEELLGDGEYFLLFLDFFDLGGSDSAPKIDTKKCTREKSYYLDLNTYHYLHGRNQNDDVYSS